MIEDGLSRNYVVLPEGKDGICAMPSGCTNRVLTALTF